MKLLSSLVLSACIIFLASQVEANNTFSTILNDEIAAQTEFNQIQQLMAAHNVPGISMAVIRNKTLYWSQSFGVLQTGKIEKVNSETVFSVGSISKIGTAMLVLKQVEQGKLDLNVNINNYLKQWKVPVNHYTKNQPVTLTNTLSHTAGFNVHGFGDFQPGEKLPTTLEIIKGKYPAKNSAVTVIFKPNTEFKYSGGGTTVQQLILEETLSKDFADLAQQYLFNPLKMNRSSYQNPLPANHGNIAKAHGRNGEPRALPRGYEAMPEKAASGLWTTPADLSKIIISLMRSYNNEENTFLSSNLTKKMMTRVEPGKFGLGPIINQDFTFQHGGSNDSYKAFFKGNLKTGDGYIILTNGANGGRFIRQLRAVMENLL